MTTPAPRAGRNLPAAIAVAVALASLIILSLVIRREGFVLLAGAAGAVAAWELMNALKNRPGGIRVPVVPTVIGPMVIVWATWFAGGSGAALAAVGMLVLQVVWRAYRPQRDDVEDPHHAAPTGLPRALADVTGAALITGYVGVLAACAVLLVAPEDGVMRVIALVLMVACSDIGGYATGVFLGRRPMAPNLSPKKSWEGFAGSVALAALGGVASMAWLVDGPLWVGVPLGIAVALASTVGDFAESALKRDLGIKDMSDLLPGHGGIMDRLDSLLVAAPVAWAILAATVPAP
ncbi:phosphatidate cytidylyltransferase [Kytococcus sedentarius]|uniref:Phosphatidate cytidylyltransferase n=1 Tax=Kytococcus sedentarius (strain ATCC 14392 / DSM 20547 / JCM 11482 / CCUG 33030 / NBRC 15357 / NCTC 11040 / CCM 314 / 541) TaxID=478801 RepID=C7NGZ3_KYTSD|nr:phosphatidate cytidylyltransferase [Kytococcus sedentarius]ACV06163.1 CDP-diglyceride synthetase [Kytococcus sedentarius DSM 20547]QQB64517.1 phosphatidate cytidylyltransferase [Kytococcus sedentarius]STX12416.1 Phosphatidate cytidylyltransferase [Kytococcus sedentarius]